MLKLVPRFEAESVNYEGATVSRDGRVRSSMSPAESCSPLYAPSACSSHRVYIECTGYMSSIVRV
jgi:hypothetical protein